MTRGPLAFLSPHDIYEDEEGVTLRFELAGVDPKDVDIRFENGVLTLRAEAKPRPIQVKMSSPRCARPHRADNERADPVSRARSSFS